MAKGHHLPARKATELWFHAVTRLYILATCCCRAALVVIDDFNPRVQYNTPVLPDSTCKFQPDNKACDGNWWFEHDDSRGPYENHTVHTTYGPGTAATLEFTGTSVALYGIVLEQYGAHALVTLDGARSSFDCNTTGLPDGATLLTKQLLFSKAGLDPSVPHEIVVAYDDSTFDATNRAWLSIDYFEIDGQALTTQTPTVTVAVPTGVTAGAPNGSSTESLISGTLSPSSGKATSAGDPPPSTSGPSTTSTSPKIGVIIGGVFGGLAVLFLGGFMTLLNRKKQRRQQQDDALSDASPQRFIPTSDPTTTPYIVPPAMKYPPSTSYGPSSLSDDSSLVPPPYTAGEGAALLLTPSNPNRVRKGGVL